MNPPPLSSIHPQPPPPSSIHLHSSHSNEKRKSCPFWLKIGLQSISRMLIFIPTLVFSISNPQSIFGQTCAKKSQICSLCLKIGTHGISRTLTLIPTLVFWISKPKSIFGQIRAEKVKVSHFDSELSHRVSRGCWFVFQH